MSLAHGDPAELRVLVRAAQKDYRDVLWSTMAKRTVPLRPHVQDALSVWGQLIRRGRLDRAWTAKDLAARANLSEQTVLSAEAGHRGTAVGTMMDLADLVGIPTFGIEDRSEIAIRRHRGEEMLALLPSRVRRPKAGTIDDDF